MQDEITLRFDGWHILISFSERNVNSVGYSESFLIIW